MKIKVKGGISIALTLGQTFGADSEPKSSSPTASSVWQGILHLLTQEERQPALGGGRGPLFSAGYISLLCGSENTEMVIAVNVTAIGLRQPVIRWLRPSGRCRHRWCRVCVPKQPFIRLNARLSRGGCHTSSRHRVPVTDNSVWLTRYKPDQQLRHRMGSFKIYTPYGHFRNRGLIYLIFL